jgi:fructose-1,6-bisphosphatase/inositol monophosphatase family enzyme
MTAGTVLWLTCIGFAEIGQVHFAIVTIPAFGREFFSHKGF